MSNLSLKLISIAVFLALASSQTLTPTLVIEIARYGARSPLSLQFTNDWHYVDELTPVGMRQQYILGAAIAANYPNNTAYNPGTIYVQSEDTNLTLMSAYSQVYGTYNGTGYNLTNISATFTYPPYNKTLIEQISSNITWTSALPNYFMPIPIHAVEHESDYMLEAYSNCLAFNQTVTQNMNNEQVNQVFNQMSDTVTYINQNLGKFGNITQPQDLYNFGDLAISNLYSGLAPPANIQYNSTYFTDVSFFAQWYSVYPYLASAQLTQLFSAPLIWQVNDYINGVLNGSSSLEYILLSTDEVTLMTFLAAYGLVTPDCLLANWEAQKQNQTVNNTNCTFPTFASQLIIEYYNQSDVVTPHIIFRYNDVVMDLCNIGSGTCSLPQFINASSTATNQQGIYEYMMNCGLMFTASNYSFYSNSIILPIVLGITAIALLVVLIMLIKKKNEKERLLEAEDDYVAQRLPGM